jgi:hypothetical protein
VTQHENRNKENVSSCFLENRHSTFNNKLIAYVNPRVSVDCSLAPKIGKMTRKLFTGFSNALAYLSGITLTLFRDCPEIHSARMSILSRSACPRAGSELVVLVLEEDVGCMISDLYLGTSRRTRPLTRGVAGHVAHPIRSIQISDF